MAGTPLTRQALQARCHRLVPLLHGDAEGPGEASALTRADGSIWSSTGSSDYSGDATSPSSPSPACCVSCRQGTVTLGSPPGTPAHRGLAQPRTWGTKELGTDPSELQMAPKEHPAPSPRPGKASSRPPDGQANRETAFWQALLRFLPWKQAPLPANHLRNSLRRAKKRRAGRAVTAPACDPRKFSSAP